ncbi:MAG: thioredoxin family protein [Pseudarcicella sp.]|nr:thioredoxin family protein [Pseudarcicella sp.]MBP6409926.1 thioredoxin family protein [Pseudarcicella sp.]
MKLKLSILLLLISFVTVKIFSQKISPAHTGVDFLKENNFKKAFERAKAENKKVFVEVYAVGCSHCEAYVPTFDKPEVGEFYNKNFISCKLNIIDTAEAKFLTQQKIWIPSTPTMCFFDENQNLMHITTAGDEQNSIAGVLNFAKVALDNNKNSASYPTRYKAGGYDQTFLYSYAFYARMTKDTLTNKNLMLEYAKNEPEDKYPSPLNFLIIQKVVMDEENPMVTYMANHLSDYYKNNDAKEVNTALENIMMYAYYGAKGRKFSKEKRNLIKDNLRKIKIKEKDISARFIYFDVTDFLDNNQVDEALESLRLHYANKVIPEPEIELWTKEFTKRNKDSSGISKLSVVANNK